MVTRKPLLAPGSYLKVFEINDNLCDVLKGKIVDLMSGLMYRFLKPYIKHYSCPLDVIDVLLIPSIEMQ